MDAFGTLEYHRLSSCQMFSSPRDDIVSNARTRPHCHMTAFVYKMADTSLPTSMVWIINAIRNFDRDLHTNICYCIFVYGIAVFCVLATGLTAPYGRYVNSSAVRGTLNFDARLGWFIQELPAFLVPSLIVYYGECPRFRNLPNSILLLFYFIHYTHR